MDRRLARRSVLLLATLGFGAAIELAAAQGAGAWPERAIRIVLPFPPGGPSDIAARLAADKMQPALKQPLVIENKPGPAAMSAPPRSRAQRPTLHVALRAPTRSSP
jgi:tripartite-type tricarboxylate transporter receptor subunit TctC